MVHLVSSFEIFECDSLREVRIVLNAIKKENLDKPFVILSRKVKVVVSVVKTIGNSSYFDNNIIIKKMDYLGDLNLVKIKKVNKLPYGRFIKKHIKNIIKKESEKV